jgi:multiple sugar transport system substrate-binding protein
VNTGTGTIRRALLAAVAVTASLALAACGGSSGGGGGGAAPSAAATDHTPVTITLWSGFTDRELGVISQAVARFRLEKPWITVKSVGGQDDDKIVKAIRGGNAPDAAMSFSADRLGSYCASGAWIPLDPYLKRDEVDPATIPAPSQGYTTYQGNRCALPVLADVYGLYYNTDLLKAAGYTAPPKTASQLLDMAVKLTTFNGDGSIKVAGFVPSWGFYEMAPAHVAPAWGAKWETGDGKSGLAKDPHWQAMLEWQKKFVDRIGYDKLKRFTAGTGSSEFSASNLFETGKLAMNIDGEFRTAFIKAEHPELHYDTAPFPVDDSQPDLYGAGYVTGNLIGIPKTTEGREREAAWQLVKFLATDTDVQVLLSNSLRNVPTTVPALHSSGLTPDPQFAKFLDIYQHPGTASTPVTAAGSANQDLLTAYVEKYQAGQGGNLAEGLAKLDQQIDDQLAQSNGGAP